MKISFVPSHVVELKFDEQKKIKFWWFLLCLNKNCPQSELQTIYLILNGACIKWENIFLRFCSFASCHLTTKWWEAHTYEEDKSFWVHRISQNQGCSLVKQMKLVKRQQIYFNKFYLKAKLQKTAWSYPQKNFKHPPQILWNEGLVQSL